MANLREAHLRGAFLMGADLWRANLREAILGEADLGEADLRDANFGRAKLGAANLGGTDLRKANLGEAYLGSANLNKADLREADLTGADLGRANLREADLREADFRGANLRRADLMGMNVESVFLKRSANHVGAFEYTDLSNAVGLTQSQVDTMHGDTGVILPEGLHHAPHWPSPERLDLTRWTEDETIAEQLQAFRIAAVSEALSGRRAEVLVSLEAIGYLLDREWNSVSQRMEVTGIGAAERNRAAAFFQSATEFLKEIGASVPELGVPATEEDAKRVDGLLDQFRNELVQWPRDNMKEIVDSSYRAALIGICVAVFAVFGQPLIGAGIGASMFGGKKLGDAIRSAIKSGSSAE